MKRLTCLAAFALAASPALAQEAPMAPDYAADAAWLCLPGRADACGAPLPTAALDPDGYGSVEQVRPAAEPPLDCFYVYPTVSRDPGLNSDMSPGVEENAAAAIQFARFATLCRPFAPIYRQATLASLAAAFAGGVDPVPVLGTAYEDVRAAWRHYLADRNEERPFVLIGHSQGTLHLSRLLAEEIEGSPAHARLLSALLIGFNVEVPEGQAVGGTFRQTPLCTQAGQTGCVVSYVSFRAEAPPPEGARFGRAARPGMTVACTNPAALGGGSAPVDSYWYSGPSVTNTQNPIAWSSQGAPPAPFLRTEGLASAACVNRGAIGYLSVTVNGDPADARTDRIPGDVIIAGAVQPGWGLHLADVNLALGDLLRLVEAQRDAFLRRR